MGIDYSLYEMMRYKGKLIDINDWKYALSIALPSVVMSISYMLMQQCDKVMITNICGSSDTAVYSVIYYLGYAIIAVDRLSRRFDRLGFIRNSMTRMYIAWKYPKVVFGSDCYLNYWIDYGRS